MPKKGNLWLRTSASEPVRSANSCSAPQCMSLPSSPTSSPSPPKTASMRHRTGRLAIFQDPTAVRWYKYPSNTACCDFTQGQQGGSKADAS